MVTDANEKDAASELSEEAVIGFLKQHPDFLVRYSAALSELTTPDRELGTGVVDFQTAVIGKLRAQVAQTEDVARVLIDTSRDNLSTTAQIHECVLALLDATSFEQLLQIATVDLAVLLDVDVVTLCVEASGTSAIPVRSVQMLSDGTIERLLEGRGSVRLTHQLPGDENVFGAAAPLVMSQAMVRLYISEMAPDAMLAFGSRDPERFHEGQATELLQFLARVLEKLIRVWLDLPELANDDDDGGGEYSFSDDDD